LLVRCHCIILCSDGTLFFFRRHWPHWNFQAAPCIITFTCVTRTLYLTLFFVLKLESCLYRDISLPHFGQSMFYWRHFEAEIILLCVRWYLRYALSYREPSRNDGRTRVARRSYDDLSLGPTLCARVGEALPATPENNNRLVVR
jgi:hypothetical protein